ncbi:hypothetical protein [Hugenholtzia roseola]|uniref:hypothetical protein n=1 Tax=Hugenholtzia roseola TaxID=1002 RepID=UPI00040FCE7E|nr:hypothetical protein [Hugenholtzia roseola]
MTEKTTIAKLIEHEKVDDFSGLLKIKKNGNNVLIFIKTKDKTILIAKNKDLEPFYSCFTNDGEEYAEDVNLEFNLISTF